MPRKVSAYELRRRLLRRMSAMTAYEAERIALVVREHAAACAFAAGRSIENLIADTDHGGAWDRARMEQAIRNRMAKRS